jgi:anti-sigma factor ChrR (cupin superfamily)
MSTEKRIRGPGENLATERDTMLGEPANVGGSASDEGRSSEVAVHLSEIAWEVPAGYPPGISRKVLRRSSEGEPRTALLKLEAGFEMDAHAHRYVEHHYVIDGEYESQGKRYPAGSYRMIPRHANHGPFRSLEGALVLVIWD